MVARQKLGCFYSRGQTAWFNVFFLPILNKWPLVMNPTVYSNPINGNAAAQWQWRLVLLLEKRQSSPSVFKAMFLFALVLKRFHLPAISHSSHITFMHFTSSSGEMSPHGSAPKWSEYTELWRWAQQSKKGSLNGSLVFLRSDPGTTLCLTQVLPAVSSGAQEALSLNGCTTRDFANHGHQCFMALRTNSFC